MKLMYIFFLTFQRIECEKILRHNVKILKKVFINEISRGMYPFIGWIDFSNFCDRCQVFDKGVIFSTIDRIFIATNVEAHLKMLDNPEKALCRFEFYEIMVRIAQAKYKDQGLANSYSEALAKLLKENIIPLSKPEPW